jgi:hypothetical protein
MTTILYWIRNFAIKTYDKPRPQGAVIVDFDETWLYTVKKNKMLDIEGLLLQYRSTYGLGMWGL